MHEQKVTENARLIELMVKEELTRNQVAEICGVTKAGVDMWLRPHGSANWRPMPKRLLRLMEFELGLRTPQYTRYHRGLQRPNQ